ncbi:MAG: hypothetical protein HW416_3161 [Chloroflexi bacterium]|nr:hypothetical protein [Chloroflexota bacterium]
MFDYRLYPYARSEPSLSQTLKAGATTVRAIGGLAAAFGLAAVAAGVGGVCLLMLSVFAMLVMAHIALLRIPGLTGDTYGAIAESTQLVALLAAPLVIQL